MHDCWTDGVVGQVATHSCNATAHCKPWLCGTLWVGVIDSLPAGAVHAWAGCGCGSRLGGRRQGKGIHGVTRQGGSPKQVVLLLVSCSADIKLGHLQAVVACERQRWCTGCGEGDTVGRAQHIQRSMIPVCTRRHRNPASVPTSEVGRGFNRGSRSRPAPSWQRHNSPGVATTHTTQHKQTYIFPNQSHIS